jgi:hypothetical protein
MSQMSSGRPKSNASNRRWKHATPNRDPLATNHAADEVVLALSNAAPAALRSATDGR